MALDGGYLSLLCRQLQKTVGTKVDKVYMPFRDQLVLSLRGQAGDFRLLMTTKPDAARIHLTANQYENPASPPMLCMLLRKLLTGARIQAVRQEGLERVLFVEMIGHNELGDEVNLTLCAEIMGRYSNVILLNGQGTVIDAVKRVDETVSSLRPVLPGLPYTPPPKQEKADFGAISAADCLQTMRGLPELRPSDALLKAVSGISPAVCRQICFSALGDHSSCMRELSDDERKAVELSIQAAQNVLLQTPPRCCCVFDAQGMPVEFAFLPLTGYGTEAKTVFYDDPSALLDDFYREREHRERQHQKSADLFALVKGMIDRTSHKIAAQTAELESCGESDRWRVYGELITANLYQTRRGDTRLRAVNYFEPDCPEIDIPLSPELTPQQNAQRYFKLYRKAQTALVELARQIEQGKRQLQYLETVRYALEHTVTTADIDQIRDELAEAGLIRRNAAGQRGNADKKGRKPVLKPEFLEFTTDSGMKVLVGKNNRQNDLLTFKTARPDDIWFHARNIPGSHCILRTEGKTPDNETLTQAATIAAVYSSGSAYPILSVDYTRVRRVKKPGGAAPGFVNYFDFSTAMVAPDRALVQRLSDKP